MTTPAIAPMPAPGADGKGRSLSAAFFQVAARRDLAPAVEGPDENVSYRTLAERARLVADRLGALGVVPGDRVAIMLDPGVALLTAILGVLAVGAAYVPVDPRHPEERRAMILDDAAPAALVTADSAPAATALRIESLPAGQRPRVAARPDSGSTAYVIYTSGTTGRPKGVEITHANVLALFDACRGLFDFSDDDNWVLFHSFAFDFSVWEIWGALLSGGRLLIPDPWQRLDPDAFAAFLISRQVTVLNQTPSAFASLSKALLRATSPGGSRRPFNLRHIIFGGERLQPALLRPWVERFGTGRPRLVNMYGITETTVHATFHIMTGADIDGDVSIIGAPLPGFEALVVNEDGMSAEEGELLLSGAQVSRGYLGRPDLTAERFQSPPGWRGRVFYRSGDIVRRLSGGLLAYIGRRDQQVKIQGHRIELGDVEQAMLGTDGVTGAAVIDVPVAYEGNALLCAYTTRSGEAIPRRRLRTEANSRLPPYMVPTFFLHLPELPTTVNGKVNKLSIKQNWENHNKHKSEKHDPEYR